MGFRPILGLITAFLAYFRSYFCFFGCFRLTDTAFSNFFEGTSLYYCFFEFHVRFRDRIVKSGVTNFSPLRFCLFTFGVVSVLLSLPANFSKTFSLMIKICVKLNLADRANTGV